MEKEKIGVLLTSYGMIITDKSYYNLKRKYYIGTVDAKTGKTIKVDLDRQVLKPLCGTGKIFCYDSPEYVKDMGNPDRFDIMVPRI